VLRFVWLQGGWENDETVEEAAKRESLEEAGVRGDLVVWITTLFSFALWMAIFEVFILLSLLNGLILLQIL
jgi:8-oxo-dGTP pyrophosphatase MutT (NUDIX family)